MNVETNDAIQGAHLFIVAANVAAYFKYGIRTKLLSEELAGCDSMIRALRGKVAIGVQGIVKNTLKSRPSTIHIALPNGFDYEEPQHSPLEGEQFLNNLNEYMQTEGASNLSDLHSARASRAAWLVWSNFACWWLWASTWIELTIIALGFICKQLWPHRYDAFAIHTAFTIALYFTVVLVLLGLLQFHHDKLIRLRAKHDLS